MQKENTILNEFAYLSGSSLAYLDASIGLLQKNAALLDTEGIALINNLKVLKNRLDHKLSLILSGGLKES